MFTMHQTTPTAGDCTAGYSVTLDKEYTIEEFIQAILTNKSKDCGSITIYRKDKTFHTYYRAGGCGYKHGVLTSKDIRNKYLTKKVESVKAHGGWYLMDYNVRVIG